MAYSKYYLAATKKATPQEKIKLIVHNLIFTIGKF